MAKSFKSFVVSPDLGLWDSHFSLMGCHTLACVSGVHRLNLPDGPKACHERDLERIQRTLTQVRTCGRVDSEMPSLHVLVSKSYSFYWIRGQHQTISRFIFYFDIQTNHFSSYSAQTITLNSPLCLVWVRAPFLSGYSRFRPPTDWPVS